MERLALLALLLAGCESSDPLVGDWTGMLAAAPAMESQSEDWTFGADHRATRVNVIHYNDLIQSLTGCVETITYMFTTWSAAAGVITVDGGFGVDEQMQCSDSASNYQQKSLGDQKLTLSGTYTISGQMLMLDLNNDPETFTRK